MRKTITNIYVEASTTSPKKLRRKYGYVLECKGITKEGFGEIEGTYHQTILHVISEALERYIKPSEITIHHPDRYIENMQKNLKAWKQNDFMTAKNLPVKNSDEWRRFAENIDKHKVNMITGQHEYSNWLKTEMERN